MCGTLDYLPPEMLNKQDYGHSIDIWSIGVLTYEFLVGKPPFEANEQKETLQKIRSAEILFPDFVNEEARQFILFVLNKHPKLRPSWEQIEKHEWLKEIAKKKNGSKRN